MRDVRPLDRLASIKLKLGVAIVAAVAVSSLVSTAGFRLGVPLLLRPVIAAGIALAMIQVLARGMTSPLREMASAAKAMARGDHSRRVTATSRDEVGELARAFNAMAADLGEVDRQRRDLVANVSHELRTPIGALQAVLENLVDGVEQATPETLRTMLKQIERLGRLVSQLLDLSRLESGAVPLHVERFALRDLLDDVAEEAALADPESVLDVAVVPRDLAVEADRERIHQVVANLVENAVRHSPSGAPVRLRAELAPRGVEIVVADDGPGIAPEAATRVFERFYRSDEARSADAGGAGLGLAIVRWIVELHGGSIRTEPVSPDRPSAPGCRMVVTLPGGST
ncbi:MAG TPA: ATP-binding protein [Acidimicrobiales bacterium]|nr:ATP-binding protein [Acidimicrobiales bacterium]